MRLLKNIYLANIKLLLLLGLLSIACTREISDDAVLSSFSSKQEIFSDSFSAGLEYYPFADSKFEAFSIDTENKYLGSSSMRFDVPNEGDPEGAYAGAIFRDDNGGRDLTGYNALTFWAKASKAATINDIGFGQDFGENKFQVSKRGLRLTTNWVKYTIPVPDAVKLIQEKGMFWYAEGPENGDGYSFWIDELKWEKIGTIAQPRPSILNGDDISVNTFIGVNINIADLNQTFNLGSGQDITISSAPGYFTFSSSNPSVASVNELGIVVVQAAGTAIITANLGNKKAKGSLTINSVGNFVFAPTPARSSDDVISIFSDHYSNTPIDFFNGYWQPYQTTQSADFSINGDNFLNYTNFNFVGIQFANPTIDLTNKPNLHFNMYIPNEVPSNFDFLVTLVDFGPDKVNGGNDDTRQQLFVRKSPNIVADSWITVEFPLTSLTTKNNVGLIIFENINFSLLTNFYLDNIYFYK